MSVSLSLPAAPPTAPPQASRPLLAGLAEGDPAAWSSVRASYEPRLRAVGRSFRLGPADVDDALQTTWLSLFRHGGQVRDPGALGAWLSSTMRRACLRVLNAGRLDVDLVGDWGPYEGELQPAADGPAPLGRLEAAEQAAELWRLVETLPPRQREVLRALYARDEPSYAAVSARTGVPVGAIGPTRQRALARLQALLTTPAT